MAFDYKKEYRDLYQPGKRPSLVDVPPIPMFLVDGAGDPSGAAYQAAMSALYTVTFTLKMSRLGPWQPEGYFDYVLPPLEGFWWTEEGGHDLLSVPRSTWRWTSALRAPEYATPQVLHWALEECARKKPGVDLSGVRLETVTEGLCVQCMHIGPYDDEPATVLDRLKAYHEQTEPLVEFYRQRGKLVEVPDQGSIEATTAFLLKLLEA